MLWFALCSNKEPPYDTNKMHFVVMIPQFGMKDDNVWEVLRGMEEAYRLDLECHMFSTAKEQTQMLHLLSKTEVDGVLLWPVSADGNFYKSELEMLNASRIPVVIVDRDVAGGTRNSFIGSGSTSDRMVLTQSLLTLGDSSTFVVGNRFGSGREQVVELTFFEKTDSASFEVDVPQDMKLQQIAALPPTGYQMVDYLRLEDESARALSLKYTLTNIFAGAQAPDLFFSLDSTLSVAAAAAKQSTMLQSTQKPLTLLCYGDLNQSDLEMDLIDGLVTSRPDISISIGIRYLRDICRGFWVPEMMDSGVTVLMADTVNS